MPRNTYCMLITALRALNSAIDGNPRTTAHLSGHQGAIYDALWDPNTRTWLTAGGDGIVAEWHAQGTGEGRALLHHEKAFFTLGVHGTTRAAGTENGELFIWEANQPEAVSRIEAHNNGIFAIAWSRDSHWLTGGGDERIALWRGTELRDEWSFPGAEKSGAWSTAPIPRSSERPRARHSLLPTSKQVAACAMSLHSMRTPAVLCGPLAAGEKDLAFLRSGRVHTGLDSHR